MALGNLRCPDCGSVMAQLFTSVYCHKCNEPSNQTHTDSMEEPEDFDAFGYYLDDFT